MFYNIIKVNISFRNHLWIWSHPNRALENSFVVLNRSVKLTMKNIVSMGHQRYISMRAMTFLFPVNRVLSMFSRVGKYGYGAHTTWQTAWHRRHLLHLHLHLLLPHSNDSPLRVMASRSVALAIYEPKDRMRCLRKRRTDGQNWKSAKNFS